MLTAAPKKQGATGTFKKTFGHRPLAVRCADTGECLAMLLRPGNSGSHPAADHIRVMPQTPDALGASLSQIGRAHV